MVIDSDVIAAIAATFLFSAELCVIDATFKGRSRRPFLAIGLMLGPIGVVITDMIPPAVPSDMEKSSRTEAGQPDSGPV